MKLVNFIIIAFRSLHANKLRTSLTMLGIIIGVGAVIGLMSVGRGAEAEITSIYEDLGTNLVYVTPINPDAPGLAGMSPAMAAPSLTLNDAEAIADLSFVLGVAPVNENFVEVVAGGESKLAVVDGITAEYFDVYGFNIGEGQLISRRNVASRDMVVVLGSKISESLFGSDNPVGERIKIKGKRFTVIGVLEAKGGAFMGFSMDDIVTVPITTYQTKLFSQRTASGEDAVQTVAVKIAYSETVDEAKEDIGSVLRKRHRIAEDEKDDFAIMTQEQMLGMVQQITGIFTVVLGAIASISLLVAGIGIMNIMLVSVTERTREIGIRKAVGAKRRDILLQFLLEAAILSLGGGGIGILLGWLISVGISSLTGLMSQSGAGVTTLNAVVSPDIILLALLVSVMIGLVSGIYPAMRAAKLNPIDALHYG